MYIRGNNYILVDSSCSVCFSYDNFSWFDCRACVCCRLQVNCITVRGWCSDYRFSSNL